MSRFFRGIFKLPKHRACKGCGATLVPGTPDDYCSDQCAVGGPDEAIA